MDDLINTFNNINGGFKCEIQFIWSFISLYLLDFDVQMFMEIGPK